MPAASTPPAIVPRPAPASAATDPATGARLAGESREWAVRDRFVGELLTRVPIDRVVEVHLFAPMRQGGVESGVAVVAARMGESPADDVRSDGPAGAWGRLTVYSASYRLTVRGPDRGRWQVDVREEADAPLVTVDAVVRGVQRRAGDVGPATRLDAAELARLAPGGGPGGGALGAARP